jgi:opacity protein-like surface antigen
MYKLSKLAAGSVIMATASLGCASAVLADGYEPRGKVVYERPSDWSGFYFGVSSGYQWSQLDFRYTTAPPITAQPDSDSGLVGGHLGIQHQFGNIVLGVEGNFLSTFRNNFGRDTCHPAVCVGPVSGRLNDIITVGPRVGWAAGHWMPYATGGYASANFYTRADTPAGVMIDEATTRHGGWYLGGGLEWAVSPGWTMGLEYRHYEFDAKTTVPFSSAGAAIPGDRYNLDPSTDSITARVSWKFGREAAAPLK